MICVCQFKRTLVTVLCCGEWIVKSRHLTLRVRASSNGNSWRKIWNKLAPQLAKIIVIRHLRYLVCIIDAWNCQCVITVTVWILFAILYCVESVTASKHPASNWQVFVVVLTWNKKTVYNTIKSLAFHLLLRLWFCVLWPTGLFWLCQI